MALCNVEIMYYTIKIKFLLAVLRYWTSLFSGTSESLSLQTWYGKWRPSRMVSWTSSTHLQVFLTQIQYQPHDFRLGVLRGMNVRLWEVMQWLFTKVRRSWRLKMIWMSVVSTLAGLAAFPFFIEFGHCCWVIEHSASESQISHSYDISWCTVMKGTGIKGK